MTEKALPAPLQRAWAAGIFEAKCKISDKHNELYFDSVEETMMRRFHETTGCGFLRIVTGVGKRTIRPIYRWSSKSLDDSRNVLLFVLPLLSPPKAAQAAQMIKRIEGNPSWKKRNSDKALL